MHRDELSAYLVQTKFVDNFFSARCPEAAVGTHKCLDVQELVELGSSGAYGLGWSYWASPRSAPEVVRLVKGPRLGV